jgi:hypothetical protein
MALSLAWVKAAAVVERGRARAGPDGRMVPCSALDVAGRGSVNGSV